MHAMVLEKRGRPLIYKELPVPEPADNQLLVKIIACGICRTDLHIIDGDLDKPKLPLILGHEIVGKVTAIGKDVNGFYLNDIVGIPWMGHTCGKCKFCKMGKENLCDDTLFTGYTIDGGFAEYTVADARFCFLLNPEKSKPGTAPLLCAGLIGYRSYQMISKNAKNIGIYGFGASAHIITQIAVAQGKNIYAFTRVGDEASQAFALKMGACWAGDSNQTPPVKLDAAIIFAASGELIPKALKDVDKAGEVICGGIHMSPIPSFSYDILWGDRSVRSVANLTRNDGLDFFKILEEIPVRAKTEAFRLQQANEAIEKLRSGAINGAAVLVMS
jgi:propanol-preferring alcohol dehydrogenase